MARPRSFQIEDVVQNAMLVFWRHGYVAAAMSDIYAATGLKPGNLYTNFKDKDDLFRRTFDAYAAHFRGTLPQGLTGLAAITAWLDVQARLAIEDPERKGCLIVIGLMERATLPPETQAMVTARLDEIGAFFRDNLRIGVTGGEIPAPENPEAMVASLTGAVVAIMSLARGGAPAAMITGIAEQAKANLVRRF